MKLLESQLLLPQQRRLNIFEAWMLQLAPQVPVELPGTGASKLSSLKPQRGAKLWHGMGQLHPFLAPLWGSDPWDGN